MCVMNQDVFDIFLAMERKIKRRRPLRNQDWMITDHQIRALQVILHLTSRGTGTSSRKICDDRSGTESEEIDPRDDFLREVFHEKPVMSVVTDFVKKVRREFLGTPFPKEEHAKLNDRYCCSREDFKLFSAPTVTGLSDFIGYKLIYLSLNLYLV